MGKAALDLEVGSKQVLPTVSKLPHPLDPITKEEIATAVEIFSASEEGKACEKIAFSNAKLLEPPKATVQQFRPGVSIPPRVLRLSGLDKNHEDGGFTADVDVISRTCKVTRLPSTGQVSLTRRDIITCWQVCKSHPGWIAAIEKRGLDPKMVEIEPWPPGIHIYDQPFGKDARCWHCLFFNKRDETDNCYGFPIHGLSCLVDVRSLQLKLEDTGMQAVPTDCARFETSAQGPLRTDLKPIEIIQPQGVSFVVDGHHVSWAGWEFRVSMHPIHGLVLHEISLEGRPLIYRASLSDMVVPYGDADPHHSFKHVLDSSEPLICGAATNSLKLGCDCLGEIYYFDMDYLGWDGQPHTVEKAICLHEEDTSISWKTTDSRTKLSEVRRGRRLVISSFSTVGNYDYGWYYNFYVDGEIEVEVKLTGILSVGGGENADPEFAPMVADNVAGPVHQHLFCFRLDWNLDDGPNCLCEEEVELQPAGPQNPTGNVFRNKTRILETEGAAKRNIAPDVNRTWKIINRGKKNRYGKPVGYKVKQGAAPTLIAHDSAAVAKRAAFGTHNLWATPYTDGELYAAGEFTTMNPGGDGLPSYTAKNRSIVDSDLVTWHTIGTTHIPRPEDWPVMPVEKAYFRLAPVGFFDRSPVMNLAPSSHCHSKL